MSTYYLVSPKVSIGIHLCDSKWNDFHVGKVWGFNWLGLPGYSIRDSFWYGLLESVVHLQFRWLLKC